MMPLPNVTVVLHRMARTEAGGGPIDSVRSDAHGRYRLAVSLGRRPLVSP